MIVVTGAAGFIGSCMIQKLNEAGYTDVLAVDDFTRPDKQRNVDHKQLWGQVHRNNFIRWLERHHAEVDAVIHLGARTDTTEMSTAIFDELNLEYSRALWMICSGFQIPFLYASSAATYGLGELGYSDDHALIPRLKPLNPYGQSKQDFDVWVAAAPASPAAPRRPPAPPNPPVKGGSLIVGGLGDDAGAGIIFAKSSTISSPPSTGEAGGGLGDDAVVLSDHFAK
ncbi:MAG: NAD-dependent epimerase/dehydratase family protein, partial [Saprospiraceae bacterium]|nr:NAD-dependent epimerase/dehydratase family protein [Saprospiraceae bacterium]